MAKENEIKISSSIFPLDVIKAAAYILIEKAYFRLSGDPKKEIVIHIEAKKGYHQDDVVEQFHSELLSYSIYKQHAKESKGVHEAILKRIFLSNIPREKVKGDEEILKTWEDAHEKD